MTTGGDTVQKVCPLCAEHIQELAVMCKHCGYDYASGSIGGAGAVAKTNGLAIASMVLGILWIWWIGSVLAVIFGFVALHQIKDSHGSQTGRGMAIAGLVLGFIGVGTILFFVMVAVFGSSVSAEFDDISTELLGVIDTTVSL